MQAFNAKCEKTAARLKEVAGFMGVNAENMTDEEGAKAAIDAITKLSESINIPSGLAGLGVKEEDFDTLATNALKDACSLTNPIQGTHDDVKEILKASM